MSQGLKAGQGRFLSLPAQPFYFTSNSSMTCTRGTSDTFIFKILSPDLQCTRHRYSLAHDWGGGGGGWGPKFRTHFLLLYPLLLMAAEMPTKTAGNPYPTRKMCQCLRLCVLKT